MTEKMLIAVDGSEAAMKALDYGAEIAAAHGADVTLIHVVPSGSTPPGLDSWVRSEHVPESPQWLYTRGVGESLLETAEARLRRTVQAKVEHLVEVGDPAKEILDASRALKADVLVMGTRGLGGIEGLVVGSVAHKVMHHAKCTVIVVR